MGRGTESARGSWIGPLAAIGAAVLYGTAWVAAGISLHGFSPFSAALWRSIVTVAVLLPIFAWVQRSARPAGAIAAPPPSRSGRLLRLTILGLLGGAGFGIGMNVSIQLTGAAITAFIAGAYPVVAAAAAPLVLHERARAVALLGLGLAFAGTLLIAGFDVAGIRIEGTVVGVATAVGTGLFLLLVRRWSAPYGIRPIEVALSNFVCLGIAGALVGLLAGESLLPAGVQTDAWVATLYLGIVAGAVATWLLAVSLQRLPASQSSAYLMLNPLTGAILAVPLLGESLTGVQITGAALVLAGIGLATGTFALVSSRMPQRKPPVTEGAAAQGLESPPATDPR